MPSGKVHAAITGIIAICEIPLVLSLQEHYSVGLPSWAIPAGTLTGLLLSPDLDVEEGNHSDYIIRETAGSIPQMFWRLFWLPYAWLIPHRHPISHFPILGTLIRVGYMLLPFVTYEVLFKPDFLRTALWASLQPWFRWWLLGLIIADLWHTILDVVL